MTALRGGRASHEPLTATEPVTLLTFDVEEFDAPLDFGRDLTDELQFRIGGEGWLRMLDLLDELDLCATLFITASIAERFPDLLRRSVERHEIASHGLVHRTFEIADLAVSREALRAASGQEVLGFRRARLQATDPRAILDAGYAWDSSENPIWLPGRYNNLSLPRTTYRKGNLIEVPLSASPRMRLPLFWLAMKNLPMSLIRSATRQCLIRDGVAHLLWHPWELLDLRASGLPRYVRRPDGERMIERVASYLRWLRQRSHFETITPWLRRCGELRPEGRI